MSLDLIIRHCAPTLAGIKIGSLFSCQYHCEKELRRDIAQRNRLLNRKGLFFHLLRFQDGNALIYVYRLKQLALHLKKPDVRQFLQEQGYVSTHIFSCLELLQQHLMASQFPHEIGVFLGYPLGDIRGFMEHRGANCKYTGCWKVYTDEVSARRTFDRYKRCTSVFYQRYITGTDITQLTVAG